ncbi:hypothetical protein TPHA_0C04350 [Tetrapisispora phaffii CBS 4417]|uniref:HMG box domain-containing protein n=1 Tax=Tetrapisispora phaffii (strain ATCC 24235 / CBS 4417 / NBRC 1672 / NRRL Y-8282 / UCD 70-5) TaxID=1071381 RepID=G8BQS3_TETPH|nr:hypothetical protein TPHA_0C04350 [Tetrapisispora phaffii CBS 4417]CCE62585.1 hypothetical protein TPHA_0C04350 [Tetrapisispora phaffii CBS 4417]
MPVSPNQYMMANTSYTRSAPVTQGVRLPSIRNILSALPDNLPLQQKQQPQYTPAYTNAGAMTPVSHPNSRQNSFSSFNAYTNTDMNATASMDKQYDLNANLLGRNSIPLLSSNYQIINQHSHMQLYQQLPQAHIQVQQQPKSIQAPMSPKEVSYPSPASEFSTFKVKSNSTSNNNIHSKTKKKICTCKHHTDNGTRIPRPRNAFILFRQNLHHSLFGKDKEQLLEQGSFKTNFQVSKEIGQRWRELSADEKNIGMI